MATRKKSIKVAVNFGAPADQADNTLTTIGTPTIYIPENGVSTPVTFRAVTLHLYARSPSAVYDILQLVITTTLSGASSSTYNQTGTITNTGEDSGYVLGPFDFTAYFNTNYGTVTSKDVTVQTQFNTNNVATRGVYGYFEISYEYDDTTVNRIQTICIPHESPTGFLSTTANTVVTNMKQLTGTGGIFENYGNVVVRQRWMEVKGNTNTAATTTDITLSYRFDAGTTLTLPIFEQGGGFDYWTQTQIDASALTTNATHTFALWSSVASRFQNVIINEWITIEYTTTGTTEYLNYIELPLEVATPIAGTTSAVEHIFKRNLSIQEPSTITFLFGGVEMFYNTNGSAAMSMKFGSQSVYRSYANTGTATAGVFGFQHGFDADATNGSGLTLSRGDNNIEVASFRTTGVITNCTGLIRIIYKSGIHSGGIDNHNHTTYGLARQWGQTATTTDDTITDSFSIPDTNYFLTSVGMIFTGVGAVGTLGINFMARLLTGEGNGNGWRELYADYALTDAEVQSFIWIARLRDDVKRYPTDPDSNRFDIETSRSYRTAFSAAIRYGYTWSVTYHTISYTVSGSVQNSNGGTVTLDLFQVFSADEIRWYGTTTVTGNSSFNFTVYDNTKDFFVVAYETDNFKGSSLRGVPGDTFNVSLTSGGGGSTRIYGFGSA
jgi:hypothetical protein